MVKTVGMAESEIVFTSKAAEMLDTSVATVNRMAREGRLPAVAVGAGRTGARCYKRTDVEALRLVLLEEARGKVSKLSPEAAS